MTRSKRTKTNSKVTSKEEMTRSSSSSSTSTSTTVDQETSASTIQIHPNKATKSMKSSINSIRDCLLCPLCNSIMKDPSTLQCSHSFCKDCIADHTRNSWSCPCKFERWI